ncbi:MAG: hypothetical protein CVT77_17230 [Alphaproteobacteria bacterium HGW-Alphaproteobacteria-16]|nr:MAG: hypothetical protein CVT77_17230 [Alphaproteobacteria bacterium HGW-Alphaproteobacteria-16]
MAKAKGKPQRLFSADVDPKKAGDVIRATGQCVDDSDPLTARGWWDGSKRLRRLKASYPNGWKVTVGIRIDGSYSVSWGIKLVSMRGGA